MHARAHAHTHTYKCINIYNLQSLLCKLHNLCNLSYLCTLHNLRNQGNPHSCSLHFSGLTHRIIREKYLAHVGQEECSADMKVKLKTIVEKKMMERMVEVRQIIVKAHAFCFQ